MRYTMIQDKDGAIEIIDAGRASANTRIRALIEEGGSAVGSIDSELPLLRLRAGLTQAADQKLGAALDRLYNIKAFVQRV